MNPSRGIVNGLIISAVLWIALFAAACQAPAMRSTSSENANVKVELVTTFDGIRLYRVDVGDRTIYVANSRESDRVSWMQQQGKTQRPVSVETLK